MIARVKIAPMDHWCKGVLSVRRMIYKPLPGLAIEIYTKSCVVNGGWRHCDGRVWEMTLESAQRCAEACNYHGKLNKQPSFCEHMLEMD